MLILSLFSLQYTIQKRIENFTLYHIGKNFININNWDKI